MSKDQKHQNDTTNTGVKVSTQTDDESTINTSKQSSSPKSEGSNKEVTQVVDVHERAHDFLLNALNLNENLSREDCEKIISRTMDITDRVVTYEMVYGDIQANIEAGINSLLENKETIEAFSPELNTFVLMVKFLESFYLSERCAVDDKQEAEHSFKRALKYFYNRNDVELEAKETLKELYNIDQYNEAFIIDDNLNKKDIIGENSDLDQNN
jgi:hypothetical protein